MPQPSSIAHYHITVKLGEGGMGEVWRATDTKLNRDVAIKILPEVFAQDAARMGRFEREAQVLASLNHPNIAAIYGIEQGAIVMELVEGEDLEGPVPVETAIHYARQIAIALEAAHEKGIIHRDLKPANIKVTPDGTVKLLDFGLAKAGDDTVSKISGAPTMSPTLSLMTQAGMILGTAAYMSPEQARGKPVDRRADIWSFGVVLFELLAGKMLFGGGETVTDTIASVITREPDWNALPANTPLHVRRLLKRCLRKDPKLRLQAIGEARILLDEAGTDPEPAIPAPPAASRPWIPWSIAGVLACALLATGVLLLRPKTADPGLGAARFLVAPPAGATRLGQGQAGPQAAPSPDGRTLAFIAREAVSGITNLWVRSLGDTTLHRLDQTEGANYPFWSPDGRSIAFFADGKLKRVAVAGGGAQVVCDLASIGGGDRGYGGTWNQDGVIVFAARGTPLNRVPAVGGVPAPVTTLEHGEVAHSWPQFLPDGRHVLFFATLKGNSAIYVVELGSGKRVRVNQNASRGAWSPPGYLLFVREGTLFAQRMDPNTFQVAGEPLTVAQGVMYNDTNGLSAFAVSQNGVLAYRPGASVSASVQLAWCDRSGKRLAAAGQTGHFSELSLSPDEKSVAVLIQAQGKLDIWVLDLTTGVNTRMTRDSRGSDSGALAWSPDSQRLAVTDASGGVREIAVASGKIAELLSGEFVAEDWSPDGRSLLCGDPSGKRIYLFTPGAGAKPRSILETPYHNRHFRFSPDGKYIAYESDEAGGFDVYVASFPSFTAKRRVTSSRGSYPVWGKDGGEIYYRVTRTIMTAAIHTGSDLIAGSPQPLFQLDSGPAPNRFAVSADGRRFLMAAPEEVGTDEVGIMMVLNWAADLGYNH